jgi:hypothetical protein
MKKTKYKTVKVKPYSHAIYEKIETSTGLEEIKILGCPGKTAEWGFIINEPVPNRIIFQVPLTEHGIVAHIEVFQNGKVFVKYRKQIFDGYWSQKETWIDLLQEYYLEKLGSDS